MGLFGRSCGRNGEAGPSESDLLWALKDVSFHVTEGEVVGIIGRNGAGKSTLLKILSRITEPTEGRATIRGRVASLLEVGTGFHPDLSGRDNIYLNGAILGMSRAEISRKFDEIVAFAEIGRFVDTPVKHYSSGMYVRLAFGVAAHLDPEILIVDEVLAVGDIAFQRKCLGRMESISKQGRTVLFVSHNLQAVKSLCGRALVLSSGRLAFDGSSMEAARFYQQGVDKMDVRVDTTGTDASSRRGSGAVRMEGIEIRSGGEPTDGTVTMGSRLAFTFTYAVHEPVAELWVFIGFRGGHGSGFVTSVHHRVAPAPLQKDHRGAFSVEFDEFPLRPGEYAPYYWLGSYSPLRNFDIIDTRSDFLHVVTAGTFEEIGFDPSLPPDIVGFTNIPSRLIEMNSASEAEGAGNPLAPAAIPPDARRSQASQ